MPSGAPTFFVIEIDTGITLSEWETLAEARASLAFTRIDPDTVAFFVVEIDTGATLSEWETLAEARASVAFARTDPDTVAIEADIPMMTTLISW